MVENPDTYQDEAQAWLSKEHNIKCSRYTISRALKRMNLTHKQLHRIAAQRNQELRDIWLVKLSDFHAKQLVFIDESGASERSGQRRNGWAPKGCPAYMQVLLQWSKNWSILPAYTIDGYISTVMFRGSINGERFDEFVIEYVLPLCTPFPGRNSVLVMDNASIHKSQRLVKACLQAGVLLQYIPPYSPDFNPIEESFGDLKAWIRWHWKHVTDHQDFGCFLQTAISENGDSRRALAHFKHCHINVDGIELDDA